MVLNCALERQVSPNHLNVCSGREDDGKHFERTVPAEPTRTAQELGCKLVSGMCKHYVLKRGKQSLALLFDKHSL